MTIDQTVILESIKNKIILNGTKSKFTLGTLPSQDFILEQEASSFGPIFSMSQKTLKHLLGQISFCMAKDDIRTYLNGVLLVAERRELYLVSTDGHRMAFTSTTLTNEVPNKHEVIFPRKTVLELQRLLSDAEGVIELQFANNQAKLRFDGINIVTKLLEGKYPDYTNVIRRDYLYNLSLSRQTLLSCLNRAAILTSRFKGVRLKFDDSTLRVVTSNADHEEAVEELDIVYDGATIELGFNVTYIIEILTNMEQENVRIELTDANSSVLITSPNNDLFKYVVMPMRI